MAVHHGTCFGDDAGEPGGDVGVFERRPYVRQMGRHPLVPEEEFIEFLALELAAALLRELNELFESLPLRCVLEHVTVDSAHVAKRSAPTVEVMTATVNAGRGIVTPQGVVLDLETAGVGFRGLARLLDIGVIAAAGAIVSGFARLLPSTAALIFQLVGGFLILFGYPLISETFFRGRTVGKLATGLRVVTLEAGPIGFREAFIRSIFQIVDIVASLGAVALVAVMTSTRSQRLGDLAAGTFVIKDPRSAAFVPAVPFTPPMGTEEIVRSMDVTKLRPEQERVIRSFLLRVGTLSQPARVDLGQRLSSNVARTLGHESDMFGLSPEPYLVAVMAAHQARVGGLAELAIK